VERNTLLLVSEHSGNYHAFIRFSIALWHLASGAVGTVVGGRIADTVGSGQPLEPPACQPTNETLIRAD